LALLDIAGREATSIRAQDLGFVLGPRINAAGRMESMRIGIECPAVIFSCWHLILFFCIPILSIY
ncbi:hypothetical protein ECD73_17155, partial [Acinetobacter baumannii]|nr:hypothetical protein [Acinetobacter baumannii]